MIYEHAFGIRPGHCRPAPSRGRALCTPPAGKMVEVFSDACRTQSSRPNLHRSPLFFVLLGEG